MTRSRSIDWLSPVAILLVVFTLYVPGRLVLRRMLDLTLLWGGDPGDERIALALVGAFAISVMIGAKLVPTRPLLALRFEPRGAVGSGVGYFAAAGFLSVGALAALKLIRALGGVGFILENQAALASQIKELGLGPLYGLTFLFVTACMVLAFRFTSQGRWILGAFWVLCTVALSSFLGRRIMILFVGLPVLTFVHQRRFALRAWHVAILGALGIVAFTAILLLRLRTSTTVFETVGTSLEFALYDMLVACVAQVQHLRYFDLSYFTRHPSDFWGTNTGALFLRQLTGYQFEGGAVPPTAVGALWVYFGVAGVIIGGLLAGYFLARMRHGAGEDDVCALLYGYMLFQWFDFLRNGDVVLGLKLSLRFGVMIMILVLCFYRMRVVARPATSELQAGDEAHT